MNWNFLKRERHAIKITKSYDGIDKQPEYRIDSKDKIEEIVHHVRMNPTVYTNDIKKRDNLENNPSIKISTISEQMKNEELVTIVAHIHYSHKTQVKKPTQSYTLSGLKIFSWLFILIFFIGAFTLVMVNIQHEQNMIDETCFMYFQNGTPKSIEIDGTKYRMNTDGTINNIDQVFLNPHHRQLLAYQQCVKVNI